MVYVCNYEGNPEEIKFVTSFLEGIPKVCVLQYGIRDVFPPLIVPRI